MRQRAQACFPHFLLQVILLFSVGVIAWAADTTPPSLTIFQPANNLTVPYAGFTFSGTADDFGGVREVRIYVFDYGRNGYSVSNALASYSAATKAWSFSVLSSYLTPTTGALLYVRAIDMAGNTTFWQSRSVLVASTAVDTSAPPTPVVTDDGAYWFSSGKLHARWVSNDTGSGIAEYQYLIQQSSSSGPIVINLTSAGLSNEIVRTGLSLAQNNVYVIGVRARNGAGLWSGIGYSDGIRVDTTAPTALGQPTEDSPDRDTDGDGVYTVFWPPASDPESGVAFYELEERIGTTGTWNVLSTAITSTSFAVAGRTQSRYYRVRAKNGAGLLSIYSAVSDGITITSDAQPPQISAIGVTAITTASAVLNWTVNEPSTCQASYGATTSYGLQTPANSTLQTSFAVTLSGLAEFTDYHFRIQCSDVVGNVAQSTDQLFRTAANAPLGANLYDMEGVVFASWWQDEYADAASQQSLLKLAKTGADYVGILATQYMDTTSGELSTSNTIYAHLNKTPTDDALRQAIRRAKALGRKVLLKLHVRVILNNDPFGSWQDAWAGKVVPSNPALWFSSYQNFAVRYAQIAQQEGVELFAFGTELPTMTQALYAAQWNAVIDAIKAVYTGQLTFSANLPDEFEDITFWNRCDYLGIGPYFSLNPQSPVSPGLDAIVDGWNNSPDGGDLIQRFAQWSADNGNKPVIFTEIGYNSVDTATWQPWKGTQSLPENQALQKRAYDALMLRLQGQTWFAGMFWWDWLTNPNAGTTGLERREYTPQNKEAEQSLNNFFLGIDPVAIASIKITDGDGVEVLNGTQVLTTASRNLYAKAYNSGGADLGFAPASWSMTGTGGTLASNGAGFARVAATTGGSVQVTAAVSGRSDSVSLTLVSSTRQVPSQFLTIQAAAAIAVSGDTILVTSGSPGAPAIYPEGEITLPVGVKLVSTAGANSTVIDAFGLSFGVRGGDLVEGFTIRNAASAGIARGQNGVNGVNENTTKTIRHNIIEGNQNHGIDLYRGGIVSITNNIIRNNVSSEGLGGGIRLDRSEAVVVNNVIVGNEAWQQGGGVYISSSPAVVIRNNIIVGNASDLGGGIRQYASDGAMIDYNDVWGNTGRPGSENFFTVVLGAGNINSNPLFVNQAAGDYHLQAGSPCANAGNPDAAYNDVNATRNDMGAYGGPEGAW